MSGAGASPPANRSALHGRRKGHRLRAGRARLMEELLPRLRVTPDPTRKADPAALFPRARQVHLEIGFGAGEHLAEEAAAAPDIGFVGCEVFVNGVASLLAAIDSRDLPNIRVHDGPAESLLAAMPPACIDRVWLLYPDPWPKRRHWKRRFVGDANLDALARIMRPGAELRFATDWPDYADWTLRRLARRDDFEWTARRADDWRRPWPGWRSTRYEAKALREGRTPCYLTFSRR
jgi:tRNA (guanine-N7-)-methyltransferase